MNRTITALACTSALLACAQVGGASRDAVVASWDSVVFREDCDAPHGGMPHPDSWVVNHPREWWWVQGRTHFPDPESTTGPFPRVEAGVCVIEHHHYNPWDLDSPKTTFLGGEIHTVLEFEANRPCRFEARVRSDPYPNGVVTSFFLYGHDGTKSDEIDFEFVSRKTNDDATYPDGDPVLTNTWNESSEKPEYVVPDGLDLSRWNTFRIYWDPGLRRLDWTWIDPIHGETWLRTETDASFVPDEPMALYFNFWAPSETWQDAYDPNLQPVSDASDNEIYRYEIDYVEVRCAALCGDGTVDPGEACDDGNTAPGDGCDAACQTEPCFECAGEPSTCTCGGSCMACMSSGTCSAAGGTCECVLP